jgi:hypothetical protein
MLLKLGEPKLNQTHAKLLFGLVAWENSEKNLRIGQFCDAKKKSLALSEM